MKSILTQEKNFILTKNDIEIFKIINRFGFIGKKSLYELVGDKNVLYKNSYFSKRIVILKNAGYIKEIGRNFGLRTKAKKELILYGIKVHYGESRQRVSDKEAKQISKGTTALLKLSFKRVLSRVEFLDCEKEEGNQHPAIKLYVGVAWNDMNKRYLIYNSNKITNGFLAKVNSEVSATKATGVIYICKNIEECFKYKEKISKITCSEFKVIIDCDAGFKTLDLYLKGYLSNENIVKYLNYSLQKEDAKIVGNEINFFDGIALNLFLLDFQKESYETGKLLIRKTTKIFYVFEKNYEKYFEKIIEENYSNLIIGRVKITLEKYINFLKEELKINI